MFDTGAISTIEQTLEFLIWVDADLKLRPVLAESWQPNNSNLAEWVFNIRKGVTWHDGKPLNGPRRRVDVQRDF